jgi:hypothetical protein
MYTPIGYRSRLEILEGRGRWRHETRLAVSAEPLVTLGEGFIEPHRQTDRGAGDSDIVDLEGVERLVAREIGPPDSVVARLGQDRERDLENLADFTRTCDEVQRWRDDADDGSDAKPGLRVVLAEAAEDSYPIRGEADFLFCLPQCRRMGVSIAGICATSGKAELPGVGNFMVAASEQQLQLIAILHDRNQHRRRRGVLSHLLAHRCFAVVVANGRGCATGITREVRFQKREVQLEVRRPKFGFDFQGAMLARGR